MLLSGFCVLKNGVKLGYPFIESILSLLPICDEFVISEGYSDDDTYKWLQKLQQRYPDRIRLSRDVWPEGMKSGGAIAEMQSKALKLCRGKWCYMLQSDEIMPPENLSYLAELCKPRTTLEHIIGRRRFNSYRVDLFEVVNNFQHSDTKFHPDRQKVAHHRWGIRLVRNRRSIYSGGDGWQLQGRGCSLIGTASLPSPVIHVGYNFPVNSWLKQINHSKLYPDFEDSQQKAKVAQEKLDEYYAGNIPKLNKDNPLHLPAIIAPLIGELEYHVREELFE